MRRHLPALMGLLLAGGAVASCSRPAAAPPAAQSAVRVTEVSLGLGLGPDKRVTDETDSFGPSETIYLSVVTEGAAPSATLKARWMFEDGQVVRESSQTIAPTGTAITEFHISNPAGWPKGAYEVQVFLNGSPVESESFKVG